MKEVGKVNSWSLNYASIALIWCLGYIIRSVFLGKIKETFTTKPELSKALLDSYNKEKVTNTQKRWIRVIVVAVANGIQVSVLITTLLRFDVSGNRHLLAELLQL